MIDDRLFLIYFVNMLPTQMESPFALRLKQARTMRSLSLRDLEEKLGKSVSYVTLAKFEKGESQPDGELLSKLCSVLEQSPDFFFRPIKVSLDNVSFRRRKVLGEKETNALLEKARFALESYLEAEELVIGSADKNPITESVEEPSFETARGHAQKLRKDWGLGLGPIPELVELLESKGVRVVELSAPSRHFDGCQIMGICAVVIGDSEYKPVTRKRFTLAHELGHIVLNKSIKKAGIGEKEADKLMDVFAAEFLMPREVIRGTFGGARTVITQKELIEAKIRYGVSVSSIVYALKDEGIIGQNAYERFYKSRHKWEKYPDGAPKEPGDDELSRLSAEHPRQFQRLVIRGVSEGQISHSRGAGLLGISLSELRREIVPIVE